jgi:hypothetical protein
VVAFSTESLCERYLRGQAARACAQSRLADRRRTLRGWHLPPTQNRCIPTDSRIPSLAEFHVEGAPLALPDQNETRECSQWPHRTAHAGGDSSCDVLRPESECG